MSAGIYCSSKRRKRLSTSSGGSTPTGGPTVAAPLLDPPDINSGASGSVGATGGSGAFTVAWFAPAYTFGWNYSTGVAAGDTVTSYTVYYSTTRRNAKPGGTGVASVSVAAGTLTRTVSGLAAGTYYVAVAASTAYGLSEMSSEATAVVT
jgi:hypothetical protein